MNLIRKCIKDLNESNDSTSLVIIPFLYDELKLNSLSLETDSDYYYHNCLSDLWLKLFTRTLNDKYLLVKYLIELMPLNNDLIKLYINYGTKLNGPKSTLQYIYNNLILNSIDNENLWIL